MRKAEQKNNILRDVNFKMIHSVMTFLKWKWSFVNGEKRIPTMADLRSIADYCLTQAANSEKDTVISFGGFEAVKINNTLELRFILDVVSPLAPLLNPTDEKNGLARNA